jgi:hypothetical protein
VLPTVFGYDPRLQFAHEDDVIDVLRIASHEPERGTLNSGTFNIAGDGVLLLSQCSRRLGRPTVPLLLPAVTWAGSLVRTLGMTDFSPEQIRLLTHGRVVSTDQMRETLGFTPRYTTAETFADFDVTVLVMVRRQDLFLESLYAEHVMATDYTSTIGDFAASHHGVLDYRGRLEACSQAFGRQRVRVLPYEPSLLDRPLERAFLEWLGIEWSRAFHIDTDRRNVRLTRACVEFKRMANAVGEFDPDANSVLRGWIEQLAHDDAGVSIPDLGEYYLAPADRAELMADFADDNRLVAREYLGRPELFALPIEADIENYPGDLRLSDADRIAMAHVLLHRLSQREAEQPRPN